MKLLLALSVIVLFGFQSSTCHKILILTPFNGPSHWFMFQHYINELTERGHELTVITSFKVNAPNYTEILIDPQSNFAEKFFLPTEIFNLKYGNIFKNMFMYWKCGLATSEHGLEHPKVKEFIKSKNLHFDLIIAEQFFQESWLMFAHKFKAPILTISTYGNSDFFDRSMGILTPWSHVPHMLTVYEDKMSFTQRLSNFLFSGLDLLLRRFYYLPKQEELAQKHFKSLDGPLPSVYELEKSISIILINNHLGLSKPRPTMPGLINIGGAHIKPPKQLPKHIETFLNEAEHGAIFFSLGSFLQSSMMPKEILDEILKAFSKIKQRVLWKWEDDTIPDLPKNVMVSKWLPQNDILAHKNIVLFITHGGLFGTMESVYRGVPMLFIPFFGDQYRNAIRAINAGYAMSLKFPEITEELLTSAVKEMTLNKKYQNNVRKIAEIFNDNLVKPMDESMYWIDYLIKHKGAPHLKSVAVDMPFYEYLLLDVVAVLGVGFLFVIWIFVKIFNVLFKSNKKISKSKKHKIK